MPFKELNRRDSWPPTILRLQDDDEDLFTGDMDENPFAYFLTEPTPEDEEDDFDFEDLSAGIEGDDKEKTPVREVSPSSLKRVPAPAEDLLGAFAVPLSLRDFTHTHEKNKHEKGSRTQMSQSIPSVRGRGTVRMGPTHRARGRGQTRTRSLSASRPSSWREPSPDMWSIPEEEEANINDVPSLSRDDLDTKQVEEPAVVAEPPKKVKKRVHWGILPRRDD
jgi:hypothetical protein